MLNSWELQIFGTEQKCAMPSELELCRGTHNWTAKSLLNSESPCQCHVCSLDDKSCEDCNN